MIRLYCALLICLQMTGALAADGEEKDVDPWSGFNRPVYEFNREVDKAILKPVARGYQKVTPRFVRTGVGNFFANLDNVDNAINNLLQGKLSQSLGDVGRLAVNTTIGIGGLLDPATKLGLEQHDEDFGQTLSVWGVPPGPYLVLPFLGPSTLTDTVGRPVDSALDPLIYYHPVDHRNTLIVLRLVDEREELLSAEELISGDEYIFIRDAYLQRREYLVNDGEVSDPFGDDF